MRILPVSEMQELEAAADEAGHTYEEMMAAAGAAVAEAIQQRMPIAGQHILILVGPGNNGGDGLVAGRHLQKEGAKVIAYLSRERDVDEDSVFSEAKAAGVKIFNAGDDKRRQTLRRLMSDADVIIDALLGTGATPPLRDAIAEIVETVQAALAQRSKRTLIPVRSLPAPTPDHPQIVAVDGPSGLDFDTGEVDERALGAHLTVTFAAPKWGQIRFPGAAKVGELVVADIGIADAVGIPAGPELATVETALRWLPERPMDGHKGTFGKVMIAAGSSNYTGAAVLCATSAVRAGAGLVTLAIASNLHEAVVSAIPEVTYVLLPNSLGVLNEHAVPVLLEQLEGYDALLVGPGLSWTPETREFMETLLKPKSSRRATGFLQSQNNESNEQKLPPLIIDADGLNLLSEIDNWPERLPPNTILTPHPGEMGRLTGKSISEIEEARLETATTAAETWQQVVVLKGAFTVIAAPDRESVIMPFANPALSSAGTGDVLAGAITALRGHGLDAFEAAVTGAYLHGLAGEIVRDRLGKAGAAAGDVAVALAEAWRRLIAARS